MSKIVEKLQCPKCLDSGEDNLVTYDDGGAHCFACGYHENKEKQTKSAVPYITNGKVQELTKRKISRETCEHFNYQVGTNYAGIPVHIANWYDPTGTKLIAQKTRTPNKDFPILGQTKGLSLYGSWLVNANEKISIVITEGEIDCLSVYQATGGQFPVVSIPYGASKEKAGEKLKPYLDWLLKFKSVILAFDNDETGQAAANDCLKLFEPGKVKNVIWPNAKDANELLQQGKEKEIVRAIVTAKVLSPKNIVTIDDILDGILTPATTGEDYPWPTLTNVTYGYQEGEIITLVAATGIGKTEVVGKVIHHFLNTGKNVGICSFEQNPKETAQRIIGSKLHKKLHLPGTEFNIEEIRAEALKLNKKLWLFDCPGTASIEDVFVFIKFLKISHNVSLFVIDNLKGLKISRDLEKAEYFMTTLQSICQKYGVTVILLSHVAKDKISKQAYVSTSPKRKEEYDSMTKEDMDAAINRDGMEWESGRMPTIENIEGSQVVSALSNLIIALARNTTSQDETEKRTMSVKILKCRRDSSKTGTIFKLFYTNGGELEEIGSPIQSMNTTGGF